MQEFIETGTPSAAYNSSYSIPFSLLDQKKIFHAKLGKLIIWFFINPQPSRKKILLLKLNLNKVLIALFIKNAGQLTFNSCYNRDRLTPWTLSNCLFSAKSISVYYPLIFIHQGGLPLLISTSSSTENHFYRAMDAVLSRKNFVHCQIRQVGFGNYLNSIIRTKVARNQA